jgi:hypothetical protein
MPDLAGRPPLGQKAEKAKRDPARLAAVARLPCVICGSHPVQVHHCLHARYSQRRNADQLTIPLCWNHHLGPDGIHTNKAKWQRLHGPDTGFLSVVDSLIKQNGQD